MADAVICLLSHGADPNLADHKSMTPLHIACRKGFLATAKALLQGGADPNAVNARGRTCVHLAIAHGGEDVLRWLIQEIGASPRPRVTTPPMHAVNFASPTVLAPANLIRLGINPSQTDDGGNTALYYALREPSEEDGDDDDDNEDDEDDGMGDAHLTERKVFVSALLECQPKLVNIQNHKGKTALHLACEWSEDLTKLLVQQHQADLLAQDSCGQTPLIHAILVRAGKYNIGCLLKLMKERGVSLETSDENGWTALHWAIFDGDGNAVRLLLEYGANVKAANRCGRQPLHLTGYRFRGDRTVDSFDDRDITRAVNTSFPAAWLEANEPKEETSAEDSGALLFLLNRGVDATALDQYGNLPFFLAAATSHVNEVFLMLRTSAAQGLFEASPHHLDDETSSRVAPTEK